MIRKRKWRKQDNKKVVSITKKKPWALPPPSNTPALSQGHIGEPHGIENWIAEDTHASVSRYPLGQGDAADAEEKWWHGMSQLRESLTSFLGAQRGTERHLQRFSAWLSLAGAELLTKEPVN